MAKSSDWFPHSMEKILEMARNWLNVLAAKATAWNIPAQAVQDLTAKKTAAENLFNVDTSTERTKTVTAQCRAAFGDLEAFMRDFKRRYYLVPPLVDADLVSLELKPLRNSFIAAVKTSHTTGTLSAIGAKIGWNKLYQAPTALVDKRKCI
jgi:hypothetical protein